jgi:hypothetical protein
MKRRDFFKIAIVGPSALALARSLPPLPEIPDDLEDLTQESQDSAAGFSERRKNAMLNSAFSSAAFLALLNVDDEIVGVSRIRPEDIRPASGGEIVLPAMEIQVEHACFLSGFAILDAELKRMITIKDVAWAGGRLAEIGASVTIGLAMSV